MNEVAVATLDLKNTVTNFLESKIPVVADFVIRIIIAFLIYYVGKKLIYFLLGIVKKTFEKSRIEEGVAAFLRSIIKFALYFVLFLVIFQFLGFETSSVIAILGSAGLAIGLALQGSLANFAGGVLILVMKPFVVGDYIIVGGLEGTVQNIDIIYTKLQMADNRTVIMPNGKLADSDIINVTNQDKRRIDLTVGVDYSCNIKKVRDVLQKIIDQKEQILREEPVDIVVDSLGASSVDMVIHVWVKREDYAPVRWALLEEIKETFEKEGITIPYDHLEVNINNP